MGVGLNLRSEDDFNPSSNLDIVPYYGYLPAAGEGITVYIIDSGVITEHPEWTGMLGQKRFLPIDSNYWAAHALLPDTVTDEQGHGSCVFSKAVGKEYGVAKKANVVIAKLGVGQRNGGMTSWYIYLMEQVRNDVLRNDLKGKAVVNISGEVPLKDTRVINAMRTAVKSLLDDDIVVVTTSGNKRASQDILVQPC